MLKLRTLVLSLTISGAAISAASADVITDWNEKAVAFVLGRNMGPPPAERVMAMTHVAMFDAVNSIERALPALSGATTGRRRRHRRKPRRQRRPARSWPRINPQTQAEMKAALAAYLAAIPDGAGQGAKASALGEAVAAEDPGGAGQRRCARTRRLSARNTAPGVYVPTPDDVGAAVAGREAVRHDQRLAIPPGAADRADERRMGRRLQRDQGARPHRQHRRARPRQTEDARFWLAVGGNVYYPVVALGRGREEAERASTARGCSRWQRSRAPTR